MSTTDELRESLEIAREDLILALGSIGPGKIDRAVRRAVSELDAVIARTEAPGSVMVPLEALEGAKFARDVLTVIGIGLTEGVIRSPDIEFLYSDGPQRKSMVSLVADAVTKLAAMIAARPDGGKTE